MDLAGCPPGADALEHGAGVYEGEGIKAA